MNCQIFDSLAGDLARGVPLEARAREEALTHRAACPRCAARLADERALSDGLRELAAGARAAEAPARVEAKLLAAFRERAAGAHVDSAPAAQTVLPFARPASPARWSWAKTAVASCSAAAAAVLLFVLVAPQKSTAPAGARVEKAPTVAALVPPPSPSEEFAPAASSAAPAASQGGGRMSAALIPRPADAARGAVLRPAGRLTATPVSYNKGGASRPSRPARADEGGRAEIATSFIPLTHDAAFAAAEGGQVVRVELPRTALQRYGLPMNFERTGERVKADLLLGHDGVARAIRFVR